MIKKILFVLIMILLSGCDKYVYYDFFVENNCNYTIDLVIVNSRGVKTAFNINPESEILVYESQGFNVLSERTIESVFSKIYAINGQDTTKVNYVDSEQWDFTIIDDEHAKCHLDIDSTDFTIK